MSDYILDPESLTKAQSAVREAILRHAQRGESIAIAENGQVKVVPASEHIPPPRRPMRKRKRAALQVVVAPWLSMSEPIVFGEVSLSRWSQASPKLKLSKASRQHLDEYMGLYQTPDGNPIDPPVFITNDPKPKLASEDRIGYCRRALDWALFVNATKQSVESGVFGPRLFSQPNSDAFELFCQRLIVPERLVAIVVSTDTSIMANLEEFDQVRFLQPYHTRGIGIELTPEELAAFAEGQIDYSVWVALEWFRLAHTIGLQPSIHAKVVLLSMAREAIQGSAKNEKTALTKTLEKFLSLPTGLAYDFSQHSNLPPSLARLAADFAKKWIALRNDCAHGKRPAPADFQWEGGCSALLIADILLRALVFEKLFELKSPQVADTVEGLKGALLRYKGGNGATAPVHICGSSD